MIKSHISTTADPNPAAITLTQRDANHTTLMTELAANVSGRVRSSGDKKVTMK